MDPNYLLPGACSIVSWMLPLDGDLVRRYLSKDDHDSLERHEVETYRELYRIGQRPSRQPTLLAGTAYSPEPRRDRPNLPGN